MSDNLRRERAIRDALIHWYPGQPPGTVVRHVTTLAAFISGIVGSKSPQLPSVATKIPDGTQPESRVKRLTRWLDNKSILEEGYFCPAVESLLTPFALETLVVVMDGSVVGRGCLALMLHVVYKGRALPLAWRVRHRPKGPCPEERHIAMVKLLRTGIPRGGQGGLSGRRGVRRNGAAGHAEGDGLVLRMPDGHEHDGDVGGGDLSPRYCRCVSPAWQTDCVTRGFCDPRGVWSNHGALLLG